MKTNLMIAALAMAGAATFSLSSMAAETDGNAAAAQPSKAAVTPHSHPQDKGYVPAAKPASTEKSDNGSAKSTDAHKDPAKDRSKHFHPRDR